MPTLGLPDVSLDYHTIGTGPHLLLIPGAPGNRIVFQNAVEPLAKHFTVTTYDRRGYSKSIMIGPQNYSKRLAADAADAAALIRHVSGGEGAFIFGSSSGAIVAEHVVLHHPEVVRKCLLHEPPSLAVFPNLEKAADIFENVIYPLYRAQGPEPALKMFFTLLPVDERDYAAQLVPCGLDATAEMRGDIATWFERELVSYPKSDLDIEGLKAKKDKLVGCVGTLSKGTLGGAPIMMLSELVGCELHEVKGGHIGYGTYPQEFTDLMVKLLL
jgi:pimeloyl-ACP methyl ester carboxylesterase